MTGPQYAIGSPEDWQDILTNARKAYHQNPNDEEAKAAMKEAIQALNGFDQQAGAEPPTGDRSVLGTLGGVGRGVLDIPQAIYGAVRHPIKTLGQMSGVSNIPHAWNTMFHDPEADWAEKLDAVLRATPINIGYAPERALIDTMRDPSTSAFDRARRGTNVASLALFGLGARKPPARMPPINAEQFGGPPVVSGPTGAPPVPRGPFPEAPPTATLEPMPIGDMSLVPRKSGMVDPTLTPPASGITPKLEPIPGTSGDLTPAPGGRGFTAEGPPTKPVTPAMEALSEMRGINRPRGSGGVAQKGVQFGEESPLSPAARGKVKGLLGEMSREPGSAGELMTGLAKGNTAGMLGFSVGPFLAWEIMRRTIRPMIDRISEAGISPANAMEAIRNNPQLAALESALVKAYMAGEAQRVNEISQQLATELMMQVPPQQE